MRETHFYIKGTIQITHPIGISDYQLTKLFPEEFKSSLPTVEELENELKKLDDGEEQKEITCWMGDEDAWGLL